MKPLKVRQIKYTEVNGLGERIREARLAFTKQSGRSLESISSEAGIDRSYWYLIENQQVGKNGALHLKTLFNIQRVLEVDFGISEADLIEE